MEQLSATDATFTYLESSRTPAHIGQLAIYDPSTAPSGAVGFKDILRYLESRLDGSDLFRRKLVRVPLELDRPYWVEDENFDLEYHVRHIGLPQPGDWRQLCILAARIYARPLDLNRPPWEFTIIEGLDNVEGYPPGCFGLLSKTHHAAIDGQSGLQLGIAMHDFDAELRPRKFDNNWQPEPDPTPISLLARAQYNNIANPIRGLQTLQQMLPIPKQLWDFSRQFTQDEDAKGSVPRTRFNKPVSAHRVFDGISFPLADVKKIRNAFPGTTVNDVMLSIVSGTMRGYLKQKRELPKQSMKIGAPVSLREDNSAADGGNEVTMMTVAAGSHIDDAGKRLEFVYKETSRSKAMTNAMGARSLMELNNAMPSGLISAGLKAALRLQGTDMLAPFANTIVTNVPGPPMKMYFAGAELKMTYGMGFLTDGLGLFHVVSSYNGIAILTFLADRDALPDPDLYTKMMQKSLDDLMKAAEEKVKKPSKTKSKKKSVKKTRSKKPAKTTKAKAA